MTSPVLLRLHTGFAELHTNSGASFLCSRTEKPTTRVTAQRNRSYKYSRPVSVTPQMRYMSRNRAPAAHRIFPKIATNPDLTDWVNRFCQNIDRQHQTRQLSDALSHALSHGSLPWLLPSIQPIWRQPTDESRPPTPAIKLTLQCPQWDTQIKSVKTGR